MKKHLITFLKLLVTVAVVYFLARAIYNEWDEITHKALAIRWHLAPLAVLGFAGVMVTSGLVWRWIAYRMGDRSPTLPLLGAYIFSQMGKYIPGKVVLLLMRIERAKRFGMDAQICTLSTLLENAAYMLSGGLVACITLLIYRHDNWKPLLLIGVCVTGLLVACHPRVFYFLVDQAMKRLKRAPVAAAQRLSFGDILLSVAMFLPCWGCGGVALWASANCVAGLSWRDSAALPGGFSASVIVGMASMLPGGALVREGVLKIILDPLIPAAAASVAVLLQRLFQMITEALLGMLGMALTTLLCAKNPTAAPEPKSTEHPTDNPHGDASPLDSPALPRGS